VCGRAVDYGIMRMMLAYLELEGHPVRAAVFLDIKEAKAWLRGEASEGETNA